jgi:SlyX protein
MNDTITDLQIRLAHQDDALQQLTLTVVQQQQQIDALHGQLQQLASLVRELTPSPFEPMGSEPPPPHY